MIERDEFWTFFKGSETHEQFCNEFLPDFHLTQYVPESVRKEWLTTQSLLEQSYFNADFVDVAVLYAVSVFERALRIRYREITGREKRNLKELSHWFFQHNYFETFNVELIDQVRLIRNGKAHSETSSSAPSVFMMKIQPLIFLTNDIYEDVNLRAQRKNWLEAAHEDFNKHFHDGGILNDGEKGWIIDAAIPMFWNNKSVDSKTIAFRPIFDPEPHRNDKHYDIQYKSFELVHFKVDYAAGTIAGVCKNSGKAISFSKEMNVTNRDKYESWKQELVALELNPVKNWGHYPLEKVYRTSWSQFLKTQ
jgi:hypothetical protein